MRWFLFTRACKEKWAWDCDICGKKNEAYDTIWIAPPASNAMRIRGICLECMTEKELTENEIET